MFDIRATIDRAQQKIIARCSSLKLCASDICGGSPSTICIAICIVACCTCGSKKSLKLSLSIGVVPSRRAHYRRAVDMVLGLDSDCDYADYKFCVIVYGVTFGFESDNNAVGVGESDVGGVPVDDDVSTP